MLSFKPTFSLSSFTFIKRLFSSLPFASRINSQWSGYFFTNFEPVHCFMSSTNCCFLSCIQVSQEAARWFWYILGGSLILCYFSPNCFAVIVNRCLGLSLSFLLLFIILWIDYLFFQSICRRLQVAANRKSASTYL